MRNYISNQFVVSELVRLLTKIPRDGALVCIFLFIQTALGTAIATWLYATPHEDNIEQIIWAYSAEWGYQKHPPLPTWILIAFSTLFESAPWHTYLLGQLSVAVALFLVWLTCLQIFDRKHALHAVLIGSCIHYFSARAYIFNHNTAMLPFIGAAALAFVWILRSQSKLAWLSFGLAFGCGFLVKYQMALFAAPFIGITLTLRLWRDSGFWSGLLLSVLVVAILTSPHIVWLTSNDFPTFRYAQGSLLASLGFAERVVDTLHFAGELLVRCLPAAGAMALIYFLNNGQHGYDVGKLAKQRVDQTLPIRTRIIVLWLAFAPGGVLVGLSVFAGVDLQNHWGTTALLLVIPAIGVWLQTVRDQSKTLMVLKIVIVVHVGLMITNVLSTLFSRDLDNVKTFPSAALSQRARDVWVRHMSSTYPSVVIGNDWKAAAITANLPGAPALLRPDNPAGMLPARRDTIDHCGALVVMPDPKNSIKRMYPEYGDRVMHQTSINSDSTSLFPKPVRLEIVIISPTKKNECAHSR
jgi:4-amino-4-deoxy-L-arabinose transferase-like glycosyltransferase